jgi:hypothetical protein
MVKKSIRAADPYEVYWVDRRRQVYEILNTIKVHTAETKYQVVQAKVLNMRTGEERILDAEAFENMTRLRRDESRDICRFEYASLAEIRRWRAAQGESRALEKIRQAKIKAEKRLERDYDAVTALAKHIRGKYVNYRQE